MQRHSFLGAAAAAAPAASLHDFLASQARAQQGAGSTASDAPHVVGAGEDLFGHPHSLGFSSLSFKVGGNETAGGLFIIEHQHLLPGGPPLHLHLNQEEWFYGGRGGVPSGRAKAALACG